MDEGSGTNGGAESRRSCTTCSKAKAKCVREAGQVICERCTRLHKECHSREPMPRRRKVVKPSRAAQLEKLENKIEHLVNALSSKQAQRNESFDLRRSLSPASQTSEKIQPLRTPAEMSDVQRHGANTMSGTVAALSTSPNVGIVSRTGLLERLPRAQSSDISSPVSGPTIQQALGMSLAEAETLLRKYQRLMAGGMPFVKLQADITALQLWLEKPLLLRAIVTVAHFHDLAQQQAMVKNLIRDIGERLLINSEKTIGNLQGILVFINWYHGHIFWAGQLTNMLHLAMALTVDLAIDRIPWQFDNLKYGSHGSHGSQGSQKPEHFKCPTNRTQSLEDHRALAGVYYLSATMSTSFKKLEPMKYSKYLDEALRVLESKSEYESDISLAQMCRIQHFVDDTLATETGITPIPSQIKAYHVELDQLRTTDRCTDANDVFLRMQYAIAEIAIWELSLADILDNKAKTLRPHLDNLHRCICSIKSLVDAFLTIPASMYFTVAHSPFGQFAHSLIILFKLVSLEIDGWDMRDFNEQLDFIQVMDEFARRYDETTKVGPEGETIINDSFTKWSFRLRWMKQMYEATIAANDRENATEGAAAAIRPGTEGHYPVSTGVIQQQPTPPDDLLSGDFFNYLDDNFWQSFAGEVDMGFTDVAPMIPMWRMN